ncbi:uncharacterized protein LOC105179640 [Sesamum indicum]|uniref:Uncharacterized protein LOC105179640 n=1 Tax=Sesamum indicum TaxID=4182 RepID=A0A6I9UPT4_SESIN|nr:uncharacterized protein LOC105179640 [Sesamum indicum]
MVVNLLVVVAKGRVERGRLWIAWDDNFIDVDVAECGTQFIHCLVYIRSLRESIAITMIYGATEVTDKRELWDSLVTIAMQTVDIPWLIGGDFNAVRDLSEICGASGDIQMAMKEFNDCIQNAEPQAVVDEFVMYYQNLLGGERRRDVIDLRFLRPWVRHLLNEEDVSSLLLPFTPTDVKQAVFDIAEDKAPGPDGYSSGFFKAAWPIVGQEVTSAVLDFFTTGRILKQINTTLLALIPKELFIGYNQALPPQCALKVDIRKAYDTVEWDFMIAVMELFGFPSNFVKWIEVCVTTTSFSVGLNGKPHGFFKGARGLRQGDPLSPYLFVLVMEVLHLGFLQLIDQDELFSFHWKCDTSRVFQLGFVDDLLLFCHAYMDSIGVIKTGLGRFAIWSGLRLNVCDRTSIWVEWLYQGRLRGTSIWTIREHGGSWVWRNYEVLPSGRLESMEDHGYGAKSSVFTDLPPIYGGLLDRRCEEILLVARPMASSGTP